MNERIPLAALIGCFLLWLLIAAPGLSAKLAKLSQTQALLAGKPVKQRSLLLDNPAFQVAGEIGQQSPPDACVTVLAYAGPAAVDYYNARMAYLLYPRRVRVLADSGASFENCAFTAVFRDTRPNLAADPFQGAWNEAELEQRLKSLETVATSGTVRLYRSR